MNRVIIIHLGATSKYHHCPCLLTLTARRREIIIKENPNPKYFRKTIRSVQDHGPLGMTRNE